MELKNKFDREISFDNLQDAKQYFYPKTEKPCEPEEYLGDNYESYCKVFQAYKVEIKAARTLDELADVLNRYSDAFDNGTEYYIKGAEESPKSEPTETVSTNVGDIPVEDYQDTVAAQYGFEDYEDMKEQGFVIEDKTNQNEEPPIVEESIYIIEKFNNTENVEFIAASFDIHEAIQLMNETWNNLPEAEKEKTTFKTGTKTVDVPYGASAKEKIAKLDNEQPNRAWTKNSQPLAEASLNHTDSNRMLIVPPGDNPYDAYIYDSLEALQGMVDGYIECTYPFNDNTFVIGNEEARLNGMQGNRRINGEIYAGTLLVAADDGCGGTKDLTEEQVREYAGKFWQPEDISPAEVADVHYSFQTFNSDKEFFAALGFDM